MISSNDYNTNSLCTGTYLHILINLQSSSDSVFDAIIDPNRATQAIDDKKYLRAMSIQALRNICSACIDNFYDIHLNKVSPQHLDKLKETLCDASYVADCWHESEQKGYSDSFVAWLAFAREDPASIFTDKLTIEHGIEIISKEIKNLYYKDYLQYRRQQWLSTIVNF